MPNDLVTRPVPVRLDDVVSTEKIINCSEPEAAKGCVDSEHAGKQAKAPEKYVKDDQASHRYRLAIMITNISHSHRHMFIIRRIILCQ